MPTIQRKRRHGSTTVLTLSPLALAIGLAVAPAVHAGPTIQLGEDTSLSYSLTLSHTLSSRLKTADKAYLADPNSDDGTLNFDRGSLITNRTNALGELRLRHDNLGAMLRASTFYDAAYRNSNDNNSPTTVNKIGPHDEFTATTRRDSGRNSRILDAYVYGNFAIGEEQYLSLKAGRHVLAWGESLFWPNISQGQSPADAPVFNVPGTEAKEGYMPVGQLSGTFTFNDKLSVTGFYQYKWEKTRLNAVGDYFGSDFFGPGAQFYRVLPSIITSLPDHTIVEVAPGVFVPAVVNFGGEIEPGDSGQWGVGGRYQVSDATEIGLYHYRYNDRVGAMFFEFSPAHDTTYSSFSRFGTQAPSDNLPYFRLAYFDDIRLTGISFSSKIGDSVQYAAELSYRDNAPVYVNAGNFGPAPTRGSYFQGNVNFLYTLGPNPLAHQTTLMGELVHQRIHKVDDLIVGGSFAPGTYNDYTYDTDTAAQTRGSSLLGVGGIFDYPSVFPGWDLTTKAIWSQNISGSAYQGLGRDERRLTLGADFKYLGNFSVGLTYVDYLSSASVKNGRTMADRDYVSLNAKYTF